MDDARGSLKGFTLLDLGTLTPGKFAAFLLADLGANVIRVDRPGAVADPYEDAVLNRGKQLITVDLGRSEGREILFRLAGRSDAVIEGFRPGTADRLGVGYKALSSGNAGLVYCALSGFGQTGPRSDDVGFDLNFVALGGVLDALGLEPPRVPGAYLADATAGLFAAMAISAALAAKAQSGHGRFLDLAMLDSVAALLAVSHGQGGESREDGESAGYGLYRTSDARWISISALRANAVETLCETENFPGRTSADVAAIIEKRPLSYWLATFPGLGFSAAERRTPHGVASDRDLADRGLIRPAPAIDDATADRRVGYIGSPMAFAGGGQASATAPEPGSDTDPVLRELGYDDKAIRRLRENGIV